MWVWCPICRASARGGGGRAGRGGGGGGRGGGHPYGHRPHGESRTLGFSLGYPCGWRLVALDVEGFPSFNALVASTGRAPGTRVCARDSNSQPPTRRILYHFLGTESSLEGQVST